MTARGAVALLVLTGCSHYTSYAAGPAVVLGPKEDTEGAIVAEVAEGSGGSTAHRSRFADARARALVGRDHQQVAGMLGVTTLRWASAHTAVTYGLGGGFGVEHTANKVFFDPVAQARLGTAFAIAGHDGVQNLAWFGGGCPRYRRVRTRRMVTLGLAGDVDARFTRAPFYAVSLMLGLMDLREEGIRLPPNPNLTIPGCAPDP